MLNELLRFVRRYDMVSSGDRVICAVSGGADSMALLWAFYLLKDKLGIEVECAHFNHGLRGEESQRDQKFVEDFCKGLQIPCHTRFGQVTAGKKGLEAAARDARYNFLNSLPGKIATAHTADDNAETVLMHLVRGTGLKGLGGIMPVSGSLIRPMLSVTRDQVIAFLEEYSVGFVEDSSNAADDFLRNRLRHHVIPLLKAENPRITQNLSETAQSLRQDSELLEGLAADTIEDVAALRKMEDAKRVRVLGAYLEKCGVKEPSRKHILLLQELVFSENPSARGNFPGGVVIGREYGRLVKQENVGQLTPMELKPDGIWELPEAGLRVICRKADKSVNTANAFTVWPEGKLILRSRHSGDALCTSGGTKSLKERFIDGKIPAARRSYVPVVADDRGVLGVYGFGADISRTKADTNGITVIFEEIENA